MKWEQRHRARVARFLDLNETDVELIAFGIEGHHLNWFAILVGIPLKSRFFAIVDEFAYLISPSIFMKPRKLTLKEDVSKVRVVERGARSSAVKIGERHLRLVNHFADKLEQYLRQQDG